MKKLAMYSYNYHFNDSYSPFNTLLKQNILLFKYVLIFPQYLGKNDRLILSLPFFFFLFFLFKIGTWANICCQSSFCFSFFFCPKLPVHSFVLVVSASGCAMEDAVSAWVEEQSHVRAQDLNWQNPRPPKQSMLT